MNAHSPSLKKIIKKSPLGPILIGLRGFFQKYFSEVGYVTRQINRLFYQWMHKEDCRIRRESVKQLTITEGTLEANTLENLNRFGFSKSSLGDLGTDADVFIKKCQLLAEPVMGLTYPELQKKLSGVSKDYWVNIYDEHDDPDDSFHKLALNPKILKILAKYMQEVPYFFGARFYYTPPYPGDARASMLWHYDNHNEKIVKLFINPFEMRTENGPTTAMPKKYDHSFYMNYPNYFDNQQAEDFGLQLNDQIELTGEAGTVHFVDTSKCFHKGSQAPEGRFVVILTYISSQHYLFPKNISYPLEKCNQILLDNFKSA